MIPLKAFRLSLAQRILILTSIIVAGVLILSDTLYTHRTVQALENEYGEQTTVAGRRLAQDLKRSSREELPAHFAFYLEKILDLVPNITRVDVYVKENGGLKMIASSLSPMARAPEDLELKAFQSGESDTYIIEEENSAGYIMAIKPFYMAGQTPGFVTVFCSLQPVKEFIQVQSRIRWLTLLGSILLLVTGITFVFRTTVYQNVRHLIDTMHRFQTGNNAVRAQEHLPGEFGELARHLNEMLEELGRSHENMKLQIEAATATLATRNQELESLNLLLYGTQKRLVQVERLAVIGQLTATFAHEIGSPLSAVSTHLQMMLENRNLDPVVRERVVLVDSEINRICGIVENLLSDSRRETSRNPVDVIEVLEKVNQLLGPILQSHKVQFKLHGKTGVYYLAGDPDQLQQLFLNLFNNSLDAISGAGFIEVAVAFSAEERTGHSWIEIKVQDSGVGIPDEKRGRIFEPFFTTKEVGKGTGLGLAVCQEIVRQHAGRISMDSLSGQSAVFTLRFPVYAIPDEKQKTTDSQEAGNV